MIYKDKTRTGWTVDPGLDGWTCTKTFEDGSVCVYPFKTREWAELCRQSMLRFDQFEQHRMWGTSTIAWANGAQYAITSSLNEMTNWQFNLSGKPVVVFDKNHNVIKLDVPAIIYLWLKTTWIPKAWKRLMWGEKGKQ